LLANYLAERLAIQVIPENSDLVGLSTEEIADLLALELRAGQ